MDVKLLIEDEMYSIFRPVDIRVSDKILELHNLDSYNFHSQQVIDDTITNYLYEQRKING